MTLFSVHACTFDVGELFSDTSAAMQKVITIVHDAWNNGADCVMLPEYLWLHLVPTRDIAFDLTEFAAFFWRDVFPILETAFHDTGKAALLGTAPCVTERGIVNRALIYANGMWHFQDKLALTPWEADLVPGDTLRIIDINGVKTAVLICLDSEMPELAHKIKQDGSVELLLVPSATETRAGAERIARCSYARAVELGCAAVTCALTGSQGDESFVGSCQGRTALYLPAQSVTYHAPRYAESDVVTQGTYVHVYAIDIDMIRRVKKLDAETNPANLFAAQDIRIIKA